MKLHNFVFIFFYYSFFVVLIMRIDEQHYSKRSKKKEEKKETPLFLSDKMIKMMRESLTSSTSKELKPKGEK